MAETGGVWGIDIGQAGLKAVRLKYAEAAGQALAVAFDYIPHPKILSQPDAIPDELINQALEKFLSRNDVKGDKVAISVPGQTALTRFIQLPPVESAKVAEIVKYEARQQIPFALEDVCWQWQRLSGGVEESGYMLEAEVGLFAMKRDQVMQQLRPFMDHGVEVDHVQIAPLALYNFLAYDRLGIRGEEDVTGEEEHTIILDMGADNTTLMVSNGQKIWIRNVPIGGNHFTRALTKEMKLTFAKAEHLKINATKAPDPRAVFQALRPVFNDYVSEIQRSIGYFSSVNRNAKIGKVLGLGNGFKLAGLQKFLQQNLQYEVERVDSFSALVGDTVLRAKLFEENILSFAVPYGLALQALGRTRIQVDLLPQEIRVERMIRHKKPWAVLTAASVLVSLALSATGYARYAKSVGQERFGKAISQAEEVASLSSTLKSEFEAEKSKYEEQTNKNAQLVRSDEGKVRWLEMLKAYVESLPRDKPDKYEPHEITKMNRIKVWRVTTVKLDDLSEWYEAVEQKYQDLKGFLREEDLRNPPTGPGYIVTLEIVHHHEERDEEGNLIPNKYGFNWVRKTLIENLQKWRVSQQHPAPTGPVPVREIGITHPLIVQEVRPTEYFPFIKDRRKVSDLPNGQSEEGYRPPTDNDDGRTLPNRRGLRPDARNRPDPTTTGKNGEEQDENTVDLPLYRCTVQFVWQPVPAPKRTVFNALHRFFSTYRNNETKWTFAEAEKFVKQDPQVKAKAIQFTQELYDEFLNKHFAPAAKTDSNGTPR